MKIVTIVGARPQFIKEAILSRQIAKLPNLEECIVHTGQHYDQQMSQVFFDELKIPRPSYQLAVGSATHGRQTGKMLADLEQVLELECPAAVLVYGDTNSTLAGALAAAKMHIPVVHVEAGLRSFNRRMPEEINRVITDNVSKLLLCSTETSIRNLDNEGIRKGVHLVGDVMYDALMFFFSYAESHVKPLADFELEPKKFSLMTCHRAENTNDACRFAAIIHAANEVASQLPVLFSAHPRTRNKLAACNIELHPQLRVIDPVSYLEMLVLERNASVIITDSGGVQKEAFFLGVPCVTIREETEWVETVQAGANILAGAQRESICSAVAAQSERTTPLPDASCWYGAGNAAEKSAALIFELVQTCCFNGK